MSLDLTPQKLCWPSVKQGDTYPATRFEESLSDTDLVRVRIKVKDADDVELLSLDSDTTGITIISATAGAWEYEIDEILPVTTETLPVGVHNYDQEITDSAGVVTTDFEGTWRILKKYTDT